MKNHFNESMDTIAREHMEKTAKPISPVDAEGLKYLWSIERTGTATASLRFIVVDGATLPTEVIFAGRDAYVSFPDLEALIRCNTRLSKSPPRFVDEQEIVLLPDGVLDDLGAEHRNELFVESGTALALLEQFEPYGPMSAWLIDDLITEVRQNFDDYLRVAADAYNSQQ